LAAVASAEAKEGKSFNLVNPARLPARNATHNVAGGQRCSISGRVLTIATGSFTPLHFVQDDAVWERVQTKEKTGQYN